MIKPVSVDSYPKFIILNGRGKEILLTRNALKASIQGSWGALFKTTKYKKRLRLVQKMEDHFDWWIRRKNPNTINWYSEIRINFILNEDN